GSPGAEPRRRSATRGERMNSTAPEALRVEESWLPASLRTLVYAAAAFVFAFPLATAQVAFAIGIFAALGAVVGRVLAASQLRLLPILGGAALGALGFGAVRNELLASAAFAAWLGPSAALAWANAAGLGACAACIAAAVRAAALRKRVYRALEV